MKIVIAPDSFKGSLDSLSVGRAIERGIKKYMPDAETVVIPLADGGEGTMNSLVAATAGRKVRVQVTGPMGTPVSAEYGWLGDHQTCVIEMAQASGLELVPELLRNPMIATTYGTGELILSALEEGCRNFILAIGGSATNDGGIGMLQALGMKLLDAAGNAIGYGGKELKHISTIDDTSWDSRIASSHFTIASDVHNPLVGSSGASYVFGPQKGASPDMVAALDAGLHQWANQVEAMRGIRIHDMPGAGAAGGIGGAFLAFFPAQMKRGVDIVIEYTGLRQAIQGSDVVFTGEGQIDDQTASGKTPMGVAQEAQRYGVPTFVLAGSVGSGIEALYEVGVTSIHSIVNGPMTLEAAMVRTEELLAQSAEQIMRVYLAK